jgi:hypothetical protein
MAAEEALLLATLEEVLAAKAGLPLELRPLPGVAGGVWRVVRAASGNGKLLVTVTTFPARPRGGSLARDGTEACGHHHGRERPLGAGT